MDFALTPEQSTLRTTLAGFLARHHAGPHSRAGAGTELGRQPEGWETLAQELGILGAVLPTWAGGEGGGPEEIMLIAEELGRVLAPQPFISAAVLGPRLLAGGRLEHSPTAALPAGLTALLGQTADGSARLAFAWEEPDTFSSGHDVAVTARQDDGEWVIDGSKAMVKDAPWATHCVVSARTAGSRSDRAGLSLFLLRLDPSELPAGVSVHAYPTVDGRSAADIVFDSARLPAGSLLGEAGGAWPVITESLDAATAAVCAEAVGMMRTVVADTVAYAKQRRQFGQAIGSFQALQHRMVDMHIELERSVSASYLATLRLDAPPAERARAVSAAKATVNEAAKFIGENAVQLHGGMGMTQELAVGHHFTRLTAVQTEYGTTDRHRARYAALRRQEA